MVADEGQSGRRAFLFGRRDSEAPPCERVTPDVRTSFSVSVFVTPLELAKAGVPNPEQKLVLRQVRTAGHETTRRYGGSTSITFSTSDLTLTRDDRSPLQTHSAKVQYLFDVRNFVNSTEPQAKSEP